MISELLPSNEDAERNLIALTLLEKRIPSGAKDLATTDFYNTNYRAAWSAFLELDENGQEIEPISSVEIMKRDGFNSLTVAGLTSTTLGMVHCNEQVFVKKIKSASTRRYLIRELHASIEQLQNGGDSVLDVKRKLAELETTTGGKGNFKSFAEILVEDVKPALDDLSKGITHRISTGFPAIDKLIGGGLSLSDVLVVAALPSAGKSAFVLQLAVNIAKEKIPVAFVSGEMSNKENGLRLLSQASKTVNLNSATYLGTDEYEFLMKWVHHEPFQNLPIYFDSKTSDLQSLARSLRFLVEEKAIQVLVIDYIQLFKLNRYDRAQRTERIAECSQEVKRIAMEFGIAVVEVAQFNREGAKSDKPSMHDLEGSGQLEKDASLIFILDRENDSAVVDLRIVKGRNTAKTKLTGTYRGMILNFEF